MGIRQSKRVNNSAVAETDLFFRLGLKFESLKLQFNVGEGSTIQNVNMQKVDYTSRRDFLNSTVEARSLRRRRERRSS